MTREELIKVLKDWKPELELMAKYNDNSIDYQRYRALDETTKALEQEPCEDCISRQAVMGLVEHSERLFSYDKPWILKEVKELPSVTQKSGKWIPVSERLPEIHKDVLLSLRSLDIVVGFRAETEPYFYCHGDYIEPQNVLAWMPLPEPYEPQERSE